ncbi:MAG: bifunctional phosphoribosyl-AMP cyclohydrolase/phosphoribosyl-ATP diphosphatase HisIE [Lachnospiraceae bacterium]
MRNQRKIACIYLYKKSVVKNRDDLTILESNPITYAKTICDKNIEYLVIFDLSSHNDQEHEEALDVIKAICNTVSVPVICGGNIHKMEDVKKILYTGCDRAILNFMCEDNVELAEEVFLKFGKEKLLAFSKNKEYVSDYTSGLLTIEQGEVVFLEDPLSLNANLKWKELKVNSDGLIPVIVQDYKTNEVLMLAYMNETAYNTTIELGKMTYFSRSRNELWIKGDTSGHYQYVKSLTADCDSDTLLAKVKQVGVACHTGKMSCFFQDIVKNNQIHLSKEAVLDQVFSVIEDRKVNPKEGSYTNYLFDKGTDKILKKLGEEATEIIIAAKNPNPNEIKYEIADFLYHMMVLMADKNVTWDEISEELSKR